MCSGIPPIEMLPSCHVFDPRGKWAYWQNENKKKLSQIMYKTNKCFVWPLGWIATTSSMQGFIGLLHQCNKQWTQQLPCGRLNPHSLSLVEHVVNVTNLVKCLIIGEKADNIDAILEGDPRSHYKGEPGPGAPRKHWVQFPISFLFKSSPTFSFAFIQRWWQRWRWSFLPV